MPAAATDCLLKRIVNARVHKGIEFAHEPCLLPRMDWGSYRRFVPFLSAAIAALALYRLLETGLGFSSTAVFAFGLYGAGLIGVPVGVALLIGKQRQRNK